MPAFTYSVFFLTWAPKFILWNIWGTILRSVVPDLHMNNHEASSGMHLQQMG